MAGFAAVLRKDLRLELRSGESTISLAALALLVLVVLVFSLERTGAESADTAAGALWVALVFAGLLSATRALSAERENGCIRGLLMSPLDPGALFVSKLAAAFVFMTVAEGAVVALMILLFNLEIHSGLALLIVPLVLGTAGFAAVASLLAAISSRTRASELLLPLLAVPMFVPALIAGVRASAAALGGAPLSAMLDWLGILAAFDVLFVTAGYLLFEQVIGED
ncbi:MAG: heme exporter protein CcmB [Candidatus Binataceae bacterium]